VKINGLFVAQTHLNLFCFYTYPSFPCYLDERRFANLGGLLSAQDDRGITPLMVAASYGSLGSVKQLVTLGASVSLQDERGYSAFHFAAEKVKQQSSIK